MLYWNTNFQKQEIAPLSDLVSPRLCYYWEGCQNWVCTMYLHEWITNDRASAFCYRRSYYLGWNVLRFPRSILWSLYFPLTKRKGSRNWLWAEKVSRSRNAPQLHLFSILQQLNESRIKKSESTPLVKESRVSRLGKVSRTTLL